MLVGQAPLLALLGAGDEVSVGALLCPLKVADAILPVVKGKLVQRLTLELEGQDLADRLLGKRDAADAEAQEADRAEPGFRTRRFLRRGIPVFGILGLG